MELLKKIIEGDEDAFRRLFDMYYQRLFHVALYFMKNRQSAEEVVADVFFIIWKRKERLGEIEDLSNYLYTSVKNQALQYLKRNIYKEDNTDLYSIEYIADETNPEAQLLSDECQALIQEAINSLPPKCKEVFRLVLSDKLTHKQIAALLDISEKTVEAHIANAYKKISASVNKKYSSKNLLGQFFIVFV